MLLHRIGYAIAHRLGQDGAKVMISSRKQANVDKAVQTLQNEGTKVLGTVCHVGKDEDRKKLISRVYIANVDMCSGKQLCL